MSDPVARLTLESHRLRIEKLEEFAASLSELVLVANSQIEMLGSACQRIAESASRPAEQTTELRTRDTGISPTE